MDCFWHSFLFMGRGVHPYMGVPTWKMISPSSLEEGATAFRSNTPGHHGNEHVKGKTGTCDVVEGHVSLH